MSTFEIINAKLDGLGGEMKAQTATLTNIESNTKTLAVVATQDQEARDRIYEKLADGILRLARVMGWGLLIIMVIVLAAFFKQEINAKYDSQGASFKMGNGKE